MHALKLTLLPRDGALVRVLGLVERRGLSRFPMGMKTSESGQCEVSLQVKSARSVDLLRRQLDRLMEVLQVEVVS